MSAYDYLGISAIAVSLAPQITPQLRMIAKTIRRDDHPNQRPTWKTKELATTEPPAPRALPYGPGADLVTSWPHYLASSESADAKKLLLVLYSVPAAHRRSLPIEAYCVAAGVSPLTILGILTGEVVRLGAQASTIIAAVNHPRVVQKSVDMALTDEGIDDRTLLAKATGFLPSPKGSQINIHNAPTASATALAAPVIAPPPEQTIRRAVDRFNDARLLPAAPTISLPAPSPQPEFAMIEIDDPEYE